MYESFFGLTGLPFKITPDDRVFYGGAQRQDMLEALIYTIGRGEGLVTVIGEVGTGKTTLARTLSKRLPSSVCLVSIYMPNVQPIDMLYMIAQELGLSLGLHQPKYVVVEALRDYLLKQQLDGKQTLLLIDEAQTMPLETLEELRLLTNMQTDDFKLLQIILFGQQELDHILSLPQLRQVKDRIVYHLELKPFTLSELDDYLEFRVRQVGYRGNKFFSLSVVEAIYQSTKGFPRAVNKLADHVLMSAFAQQSQQITLEHVGVPIHAAAIHFRQQIPHWFAYIKRSLWLQLGIGSISIVFLLFLFSALFSRESSVQHQAIKAAEDIQDLTSISKAVVDPTVTELSVESNRQQVNTSLPDKTHTLVGHDTLAVTAVNVAKLVKSDPEPKSSIKRNPLSYWLAHHDATSKEIEMLAKEDKYSIQLMSDPWRLRDDFSVTASLLTDRLPDNLTFITDYVLSDGRPRIALLYGVYNSRGDAQYALRDLPSSAKSYAPVVIGFKQVFEQMNKSTALQMEP